MKIQGKVWKFGDDIDTDVIIPARYLNTTDPAELAKHCMEDADPQFASKVQKGDIIVAGKNFGCGSSREHAPISIKASGIECVVASSFARIFFRNSFNTGLPIFESEEASAGIRQGDVISVDFETGIIVNTTRNQTYQSQPLPEFMQELLNAGGLMNYVRNKK
ncbi:MAG: 3-isopropylmalate dehydratase small subunit [Candidatus Auribacterota bacterium]